MPLQIVFAGLLTALLISQTQSEARLHAKSGGPSYCKEQHFFPGGASVAGTIT
jgi:hypothetical protein